MFKGQTITKTKSGRGVVRGKTKDSEYWCGIAHTRWGDIPGKCHGDKMWYGYKGKEYTTKDFSFVLYVPPVKREPLAVPQGDFYTDSIGDRKYADKPMI